MKSYLFDWRSLKPEELYEANSDKTESLPVASIPVIIGDEYYMIVISHENSNNKTCFRLVFYKSNENWESIKWLGWDEEIKTTKSYRMFCKRVEDIAIWFLLNE